MVSPLPTLLVLSTQFLNAPLWPFQTTRTFSRSLRITFHPEVSFNLMAFLDHEDVHAVSWKQILSEGPFYGLFLDLIFKDVVTVPRNFLLSGNPPFDIFQVRPVTFCLGFFWSFFSLYQFSVFFLSLVLPATNLLDLIQSFHLPF